MRALERAGAEVTLTADRQPAQDADGLVVPGVGAFAACMAGLRGVQRSTEVIGRRLAGGRPVLGICVGMQVLFERGVEHGVETDGLRRVAGRGRAAAGAGRAAHGLEHRRGARRSRALFAGVEGERFYFVHSYGVRAGTLETNDRTRAPLVTWAEHGGDRFVAAVENGPLSATQFHPEKSGDAGAALLRNWVGGPVSRRSAPQPPRAERRAGGGDQAPRGRGERREAERRSAAPTAAQSRTLTPGWLPASRTSRPARRPWPQRRRREVGRRRSPSSSPSTCCVWIVRPRLGRPALAGRWSVSMLVRPRPRHAARSAEA